MLHRLIDRSPDLKRLRDEGYEIQVRGGHLLVDHVPYVNAVRQIEFGTLVTDLTIAGDRTGPPSSHVIYFSGEQPCHKDGTVINALVHGQQKTTIGDGIEIDRSFSNKPPNGYSDFYEKFKTYIDVISAPARSLDPSVKATTFRLIDHQDPDSPFNYPDTNSSRARITPISDKLKDQRIGIVGVGGTGSYVLDFLSKTPVKEIHLFDKDEFLLHNSFRSPGAAASEDLIAIKSKVAYFKGIYSRMHKGVIAHDEYLTESNLSQVADLSFVFICIDKGSEKRGIINYLNSRGINFIDVGMGIEVSDKNSLFGMLRVTSSFNDHSEHIFSKGRISFAEAAEEDLYSQNVQIAELNALNAALAVIKWKKFMGFYLDVDREKHSLFSIDDNSIINEDFGA
jgi:hypothetical protein